MRFVITIGSYSCPSSSGPNQRPSTTSRSSTSRYASDTSLAPYSTRRPRKSCALFMPPSSNGAIPASATTSTSPNSLAARPSSNVVATASFDHTSSVDNLLSISTSQTCCQAMPVGCRQFMYAKAANDPTANSTRNAAMSSAATSRFARLRFQTMRQTCAIIGRLPSGHRRDGGATCATRDTRPRRRRTPRRTPRPRRAHAG